MLIIEFEAIQTNGNKFTNPKLDTTATGNGVTSNVNIVSSGFAKTALLLEPFKWEFGDLYPTVGADLYSKGYAVTDYSDAGVKWANVYQLAQNTVSLINTHGYGDLTKGSKSYETGLMISNTADPLSQYQSWAQLVSPLTNSAYKGKNDLMILSACGSFFKNSVGFSGQDIAQNAKVSGGFATEINWNVNTVYLKTLFDSLTAGGNTINTATVSANNAVKNSIEPESMQMQFNKALGGNGNFKLP